MLKWTCPKCNKAPFLPGRKDVVRGHASSCEVASWSPEKQAAMKKCVGVGVRGMLGGPTASDAEKDEAVDEAVKHVR